MKFGHLFLVFALCFSTVVYSQSGSAGASGLAFLKIGAGARAASMGEAYTALANDVNATYWNPAGLSFLNRTQVSFTHSELLQDISHEFLGFAFPIFKGMAGISILTGNVDGIEHRTTASAEPIGTIEANDVAASLSYSRILTQRVSLGLTAKYIYEKIYIESTSGYAVDFGLAYSPLEIPFKFGFVIQNIGSMNNLLNESIKLPQTIKLGVAYQIQVPNMDSGFLIAADAVKLTEADLRMNLGFEFLFKNHFSFRLGYQSGFDDKTISSGFGLFMKKYHFDYGYTPFSSELGNTHKFTLGLDL